MNGKGSHRRRRDVSRQTYEENYDRIFKGVLSTRPPAETLDHRVKLGDHRWRVQSDDEGRFDEIVVVIGKDTAPGDSANGLVLHAEMMDDRCCFVDVAGLCLWVQIGDDGISRITHAENRRPDRAYDVSNLVADA